MFDGICLIIFRFYLYQINTGTLCILVVISSGRERSDQRSPIQRSPIRRSNFPTGGVAWGPCVYIIHVTIWNVHYPMSIFKYVFSFVSFQIIDNVLGSIGHTRLYLLYTNHSEHDALFHSQLDSCVLHNPRRFAVTYVFTKVSVICVI